MNEWIFIFRLFVATLLGFIIGFERKARVKEAGIRTHAIVAAGACLITLISKYGFEGSDGSRVAAQIVSGVGFLGAGMILYKRHALQGLTTAAGIWTTAGIGMAAGVGMYILAGGASLLIIIVQMILHLPIGIFRKKNYLNLRIVYVASEGASEKVKELFHVKRFSRINAVRRDGEIVYDVVLTTKTNFTDFHILETMKENEFIFSVTRADEE